MLVVVAISALLFVAAGLGAWVFGEARYSPPGGWLVRNSIWEVIIRTWYAGALLWICALGLNFLPQKLRRINPPLRVAMQVATFALGIGSLLLIWLLYLRPVE